jgi:hypothetical protein
MVLFVGLMYLSLGRLSYQDMLVSDIDRWGRFWFDPPSIVTLQIAQTHHPPRIPRPPQYPSQSLHNMSLSPDHVTHPRNARTPDSTPRLLQPTLLARLFQASKTHDSAPSNNSHDLSPCRPKCRAPYPIGLETPDSPKPKVPCIEGVVEACMEVHVLDLRASCDLCPSLGRPLAIALQ